LLWLWYKLPIRWAETITVISSATLEELLGYIPEAKGKVKVIMNCIPSEYQPFPRTLNAQKPIILQIGTNPNKNIERVAEALQGVSCHWRIIGCLTPEQRRSIESHSIEFSNVYDLSDEQMLREYHECDALVFVSTYEGFGMPIVEAQAVGRPVVTSNLSSMPEVAGEAAVLVDPLDISSIRTAILKVISDSEYREQIVQRGFENVKRFRPESIALEYFSIYQKLIS
jgi:glycosyltransferase involved in cell wall biosynthesis